MKKLSLLFLVPLLGLASHGALAQSSLFSHQHSLTGLNDPEPAAPRFAVQDASAKAYLMPESGQPAEPAATPAPPPAAAPGNPAKALPDTSISLTRP